jgi:pimeloyl-ACP methyl ester carboxylesterase
VPAWRVIGGEWFDEARIRARAAAHFDRCYHPQGIARQLVGVLASGDRTEKLRSVKTPTLVIHGAVDPLVPPAAGKATAAAISGAELMLVDGMGHDVVPHVWPSVVDAISKLSSRN